MKGPRNLEAACALALGCAFMPMRVEAQAGEDHRPLAIAAETADLSLDLAAWRQETAEGLTTTSPCSSLIARVRHAHAHADGWRLEWLAGKGLSLCEDTAFFHLEAMRANLLLDRPQHAYRHWVAVYGAACADLQDTAADEVREPWRLSIRHALAETPWATLAREDFKAPPAPWNPERASALSILPGLGQFYLGQWGLGFQYLALNAACAAFMGWRLASIAKAWPARTEDRRSTLVTASLDLGVVATLLWPRYGLSAGREASREARRRNREWHRRQITLPP